VFFVSGRATE